MTKKEEGRMIVKMIEDTKGFVGYKTVGPDELWWTERGWFLVAIMVEDTVQTVDEPLPAEFQPKDQRPDYNNNHIRTVKKPIVVQTTRYLLGRTEGGVIADLNAKLEAEERDHKATVGANNKLSGENDNLQKKVADLEGTVKRFTDALKTANADYETSRVQNRKYENDLGKLRQALGDLKLKEILEGG